MCSTPLIKVYCRVQLARTGFTVMHLAEQSHTSAAPETKNASYSLSTCSYLVIGYTQLRVHVPMLVLANVGLTALSHPLQVCLSRVCFCSFSSPCC